MMIAQIAFGVFARVNSPKARQAWKACGQSLSAPRPRPPSAAGSEMRKTEFMPQASTEGHRTRNPNAAQVRIVHRFGCIPFIVATGGSAHSGATRVLRPGVATRVCAVQHESIPGAVSEDPRTADAAHPGAGRRETGRGVPPSGIGGVFARFDGRDGGGAGSIECRA